MSELIRVPYAIGSGPGWWTKYHGVRVNCPKCGKYELVYWASPTDHIFEDGTFKHSIKCPDCGLEGTFTLEGAKETLAELRRFEEHIRKTGSVFA